VTAPDLIRFLVAEGGVSDPAGDLRAMDLHRVQKGWFGRLCRSNGLPLDEACLRAWQAGYLPGSDRPDINALLEALRAASFDRQYLPEEDPAIETAVGTDEDEARRLLALIVGEVKCGGEGKRKRLRVLIREAERMVA
jgi:hypothetical protein